MTWGILFFFEDTFKVVGAQSIDSFEPSLFYRREDVPTSLFNTEAWTVSIPSRGHAAPGPAQGVKRVRKLHVNLKRNVSNNTVTNGSAPPEPLAPQRALPQKDFIDTNAPFDPDRCNVESADTLTKMENSFCQLLISQRTAGGGFSHNVQCFFCEVYTYICRFISGALGYVCTAFNWLVTTMPAEQRKNAQHGVNWIHERGAKLGAWVNTIPGLLNFEFKLPYVDYISEQWNVFLHEAGQFATSALGILWTFTIPVGFWYELTNKFYFTGIARKLGIFAYACAVIIFAGWFAILGAFGWFVSFVAGMMGLLYSAYYNGREKGKVMTRWLTDKPRRLFGYKCVVVLPTTVETEPVVDPQPMPSPVQAPAPDQGKTPTILRESAINGSFSYKVDIKTNVVTKAMVQFYTEVPNGEEAVSVIRNGVGTIVNLEIKGVYHLHIITAAHVALNATHISYLDGTEPVPIPPDALVFQDGRADVAIYRPKPAFFSPAGMGSGSKPIRMNWNWCKRMQSIQVFGYGNPLKGPAQGHFLSMGTLEDRAVNMAGKQEVQRWGMFHTANTCTGWSGAPVLSSNPPTLVAIHTSTIDKTPYGPKNICVWLAPIVKRYVMLKFPDAVSVPTKVVDPSGNPRWNVTTQSKEGLVKESYDIEITPIVEVDMSKTDGIFGGLQMANCQDCYNTECRLRQLDGYVESDLYARSNIYDSYDDENYDERGWGPRDRDSEEEEDYQEEDGRNDYDGGGPTEANDGYEDDRYDDGGPELERRQDEYNDDRKYDERKYFHQVQNRGRETYWDADHEKMKRENDEEFDRWWWARRENRSMEDLRCGVNMVKIPEEKDPVKQIGKLVDTDGQLTHITLPVAPKPAQKSDEITPVDGEVDVSGNQTGPTVALTSTPAKKQPKLPKGSATSLTNDIPIPKTTAPTPGVVVTSVNGKPMFSTRLEQVKEEQTSPSSPTKAKMQSDAKSSSQKPATISSPLETMKPSTKVSNSMPSRPAPGSQSKDEKARVPASQPSTPPLNPDSKQTSTKPTTKLPPKSNGMQVQVSPGASLEKQTVKSSTATAKSLKKLSKKESASSPTPPSLVKSS